MHGNFGDGVLVLKYLVRFLVVVLWPLLLPTPAGGAAPVIVLAAVALLVAVVALTAGGAAEASTGPPVGRPDLAGPPPHCGLRDPDSPGHVRARAPGAIVRSA